MRVVVDRDLCESNGKCMEAAPAVFLLDEDDVIQVLVEHPGEDLRAAVELAVLRCPKAAISIVEEAQDAKEDKVVAEPGA